MLNSSAAYSLGSCRFQRDHQGGSPAGKQIQSLGLAFQGVLYLGLAAMPPPLIVAALIVKSSKFNHEQGRLAIEVRHLRLDHLAMSNFRGRDKLTHGAECVRVGMRAQV